MLGLPPRDVEHAAGEIGQHDPAARRQTRDREAGLPGTGRNIEVLRGLADSEHAKHLIADLLDHPQD